MEIEILPGRNALRLVVRPPLAAAAAVFPLAATLDVGTRGRLLGLELPLAAAPALAAPWRSAPAPPAVVYDAAGAALYVAVAADDTPEDQTRTVSAPVRVLADERGGLVAIEIPRRGHGYEIAYPSGNR